MTTLRAFLDSQRPHHHEFVPVAEVTDGPDIEWCPSCGACRPRPEYDDYEDAEAAPAT